MSWAVFVFSPFVHCHGICAMSWLMETLLSVGYGVFWRGLRDSILGWNRHFGPIRREDFWNEFFGFIHSLCSCLFYDE